MHLVGGALENIVNSPDGLLKVGAHAGQFRAHTNGGRADGSTGNGNAFGGVGKRAF